MIKNIILNKYFIIKRNEKKITLFITYDLLNVSTLIFSLMRFDYINILIKLL